MRFVIALLGMLVVGVAATRPAGADAVERFRHRLERSDRLRVATTDSLYIAARARARPDGLALTLGARDARRETLLAWRTIRRIDARLAPLPGAIALGGLVAASDGWANRSLDRSSAILGALGAAIGWELLSHRSLWQRIDLPPGLEPADGEPPPADRPAATAEARRVAGDLIGRRVRLTTSRTVVTGRVVQADAEAVTIDPRTDLSQVTPSVDSRTTNGRVPWSELRSIERHHSYAGWGALPGLGFLAAMATLEATSGPSVGGGLSPAAVGVIGGVPAMALGVVIGRSANRWDLVWSSP